MTGAGRQVAEAVLLHHERLDGFGYPRGVAGEDVTLDGQIVGVAEWLMALIDSGFAPLARARLARRLMPGEFADALLSVVVDAARSCLDAAPEAVQSMSVDDALPRVERIMATLTRHRESLDWIEGRIQQAGPALRAFLEAGRRRVQRIQASFSSIGFDAKHPAVLLSELAALDDARSHLEVATLLRELQWRMRELERESRLRAWMLSPDDAEVVAELLSRVRGEASPPVVTPSDPPSPAER
jgi:hypothetical protein